MEDNCARQLSKRVSQQNYWGKFSVSSMVILAIFGINIAVFLIAYNNSEHGKFIFVALILLNLLMVSIPDRYRPRFVRTSSVKASALCFCSLWSVLLFIEIVFPLVTPKEYAQISDLSNRFLKGQKLDKRAADITYPNDAHLEPNRSNTKICETGSLSWHKPGYLYVYYGYEPNLKKTYENHVTWNSLGYFDKDYPKVKPGNTYRIVVIGDSYVESVQVPLDKTFHKRLENLLSSRHVNGLPQLVEVIALGASGAGQKQNFRILSEEAVMFRPDLVVMTLCSNDICDDDPALKRELDLSTGTVSPLTRNLITHGYFALAFALRRIEDVTRNKILVSPELQQWTKNPPSKIADAWQNTLSAIRESRDYCEKRGIAFLLVYVGSEIEVKYSVAPERTVDALRSMGVGYANLEWDFQQSLSTVRSFCQANDILFLSLQEALAEAQHTTGSFVFGDHYSMFGHEVVARVIGCAVENMIAGTPGTRIKQIEKLCK